ncbi:MULTISPECIES: DUF6798 domain-containing protein [unclassified Coleofasciculus]|uniref:DUF6798 domain-containing protein n=1 Tax=unclassified Coleofasciculus TaxID=2692782 RepID=UPI00187F11BF|nr:MULTISPECIES: DUF6798 domain-containing protein [unclassified Coleofasciculus]MBE9128896.1 hypothetical protein [Coleofasciculus sp. LEGE 07081]MBE9151663.1 hypothetical protein [Coleofasciculus sp. LEGE 07092]
MRLSQNISWKLTVAVYAFVIIISLIIYGYHFPSSNNLIEVPPVIALLNPEIYKQDVYVQDMLQITPRSYYQYLMYMTAKLGLGLSLTYFVYYVIAFASFILGLYAIGNKFGKSKLSAAVLAFLGLVSVEGTIGYTSLFRSEPIPAIFAMGCAIWGVYFCLCKRWILGYLFFGLACISQFLVGILPGGLMAPLLILEAKRTHNLKTAILPFLTLGIFASFVYLPMVITGSTGSGVITNEEFVYLYGHIRNPHHIIPSAWPSRLWRNLIFFMAGGLLCITSADSLRSKDKINLVIVIFTSFFALLLGYIFLEIYPLSLFAKLQLARTTPFAQLMVFIAISVLVYEHYKQVNIGITVLLVITPILYNGAIILFFLSIGLVILKNQNRIQLIRHKLVNFILVFGVLLILTLYPPPSSVSEAFGRVFWKLALFLVLAFPFILEESLSSVRRIKEITYTLAFTSFAFLMLGLLNLLPGNLSNFLQKRVTLYQVPADSLTKLALRFRQRSSNDALVLVPPSLTEFRFYSQRAVVFDFRSYSFTDKGIREWKNRMETILGPVKPPLSWRNVDSLFRKRSSSELVTVANKFGANYILTRSDWHSDIQGLVVDQEGKWVLYKLDNSPSRGDRNL